VVIVNEVGVSVTLVIVNVSRGVDKGDKVSVYVDVERRCRKGRVIPFDGVRLHVSNGIAQVSRRDVFVEGAQLR